MKIHSEKQNKKKILLLKGKSKLLCSMNFIGLVGRVFGTGLEDPNSIRGRVKSNSQNEVFLTGLLNIHHYKVRIKRTKPSKEVTPSYTPIRSS